MTEQNRVVILADRSDIAPGEVFQVGGVIYRSITGSVGYTKEFFGIPVPAGMVNDKQHPYPDNAITAEVMSDG